MARQGPGIFRDLDTRIFDSHPVCFELLESELDDFLAQESNYAQFTKPINANANRNKHKGGQSVGGRQIYRATFISTCSCAGMYRDRRDPNVSPAKRRASELASGSYKVGCEAKIKIKVVASITTISYTTALAAVGPSTSPSLITSDIPRQRFKSPSDSESDPGVFPSSLGGPPRVDSMVKVEYHWRHAGHEPGSLADLAKQRNSKGVRDWIEGQVRDGKSLSQIMASVRLSLAELSSIMSNSTTTVDTSIRIRYQDIYNCARRLKIERAQKSADGRESCARWAEELAKEGWDASFIDSPELSPTAEPVWAFVLMSPVGKEILGKPGSQVWCVDSTHNTGYGMTRTEKIFLTTILVRSQATGTGFPAAFLITPSETQLPLTRFLEWLRALVPIPKDIMVDCSATEKAAIDSAYRMCADPPRVLLCQWHVLRAWEDNIKDKIRLRRLDDLGCSQTRELQASCRTILRSLVYASTPDEFQNQLSDFHSRWSIFFPEFLAYFRREWLSKRPPSSWSKAYRQHAHFGIDTNNYIESWHGSLKVNYLGIIRKQRVDRVIFVLAREVVPDYARRLVQGATGITRKVLCRQEKEARLRANALSWAETFTMIQGDGLGALLVSSSSGTHSYTVDFKLTKCSCLAFRSAQLACKHMFMASRFLGEPVLRSSISFNPPAIPSQSSSPFLPTSSSDTRTTPSTSSTLLRASTSTAETVAAEQDCTQQKVDLLEAAMRETLRVKTALETLQRKPPSTLNTLTSRAQLQAFVADLTSARRALESI